MVPVITRRGVRSPYRRGTLPDGRPVLRKRVEPHHELTTPAGVAVDEAVLGDAEREGRVGVVVFRVRTEEELWAPLPRWRHGIPVNRGFGPQRGLRWGDLEPLPGAEGQLSLFDGGRQ